jgi:ribose transport system substrate-binding protein
MKTRIKTYLALGVVLAGAVALAGCTVTDGESKGSKANTATPLTYLNTEDGTCAVAPREGIDFEAAKALVESFQKPVTALHQTKPLPEPLDPDTLVVFANIDTAVAAGFWQPQIEDALKVAGVKFQNVSVGTSAESQHAGFNTIVQLKPDVLLMGAIDPVFVQDQIAELQSAGTVMVAAAHPVVAKYGLDDSFNGDGASRVNGRLLAAGAIYFTCGTATEFVFYNPPELGFAAIQAAAAKEYLAKIAPEVTLRVVDISIVDAAPADKIVSDLQANPDTAFFVTPGDQFQIGLAPAAELTGIANAKGFGQNSLPPNYEQVANGEQSAGFAMDFKVFAYGMVDEGFRKMQGAFTPYDDWEAINRTVSGVITQQNVGNFPKGKFVSYKDVAKDYAALWHR